ncbi:MAG: PhzF family phenazine biosynthesis isomerase [Candidatus Eisenbacteria bacterium]|nr:PhzF family phenazine biosynthesis isomerase [Candidatus Eisenbacteria bacterium]
MKRAIYQVDAFASERFKGNPAAVVVLHRGDDWPADGLLLSVAKENNLSETAYVRPEGAELHLRWFTPSTEIELCGHATLATAFVLIDILDNEADHVTFQTLSGELEVVRNGDVFTLDFPARPPQDETEVPGLVEALGRTPTALLGGRYPMAVYESERDIRAIVPDMQRLAALPVHGAIVTAPGEEIDFVSRFFAPGIGVPEDPVTGSTHTTLIPFWSERLGKSDLIARQLSERGGELRCSARGDRVGIGGRAVLFLEGQIELAW